MKSLLTEIPTHNTSKTGWPWTLETNPQTIPVGGSSWPKISIITPSLNQGAFLEEAIRSILLQNYPNLEFIVVDGGSTDNSLDIIMKYQKWIKFWVSEEDKGQSDAINIGLSRCTGDIIGWINSDDRLLIGALYFVAKNIQMSSAAWLIGASEIVDESSNSIFIRYPPIAVAQDTFLCWTGNWFPQQSTFWNRQMQERIQSLDTSLHYVMDVDLWWRMTKHAEPTIVKKVLSSYRTHAKSKTTSENDKSNLELISWIYRNFISGADKKYENFTHIMLNQIQLQASVDRIKGHIVIGNILKFWGRFFNSRFNDV